MDPEEATMTNGVAVDEVFFDVTIPNETFLP